MMAELARWYGEGKIKPVIDRTMPMAELKAAYAHMGSRAVKGKLVMVNWACSHCSCEMRCESKRSCARRETRLGLPPARLRNAAHGLLAATRRERVKTAPLVVTLLAQAASLGVVARLD